MQDILWLGSAPAEEDCAGVGDPDFTSRNKAECLAYIKAIKRTCGEPPEGARLGIKLETGSDFDPYREVVVYFDGNNQAAADYAYKVDEHAPTTWKEAGMSPPNGREIGR